MEVITRENAQIISYFEWLKTITNSLKNLQGIYPLLNGERYITDRELSLRLKVSRRTLQEYRTNGLIPYLHLGGKILYKESDVIVLLEKSYVKAWEDTDI